MKRLCIEEIQLRRKTFFPFFFQIHDALVAFPSFSVFFFFCNRNIENVNMNFSDFLYTNCFEYTTMDEEKKLLPDFSLKKNRN